MTNHLNKQKMKFPYKLFVSYTTKTGKTYEYTWNNVIVYETKPQFQVSSNTFYRPFHQ
jgi:hypothetical protein